MTQRGVETGTGKRQVQNQKPWLTEISPYSDKAEQKMQNLHTKLIAQICHYAGTGFLMGRAVSIAKELFSVLRMSRPWVIQSVHVQNLGKKIDGTLYGKC